MPNPEMPLSSSAPDVFDPARDLTVVIPTYNRTEYFLQYLEEGRWDDVRIHMVCDGCASEIVADLRARTEGRPVTVFDERPNRGVAHAIGVGVRSVETSHYMFCGDDDYNVDYAAFLAEAAEIKRRHDDVLFVTMPEIHKFGADREAVPQYDRRPFHGWTGRKLLEYLVRTGEMRALVAGSLFRTAEMVPLLPEPFFRLSEDYVLLARLCARYPERKVYVAESGRRMRRIHPQSLSARERFSPIVVLMNLVSMTLGGHYLIEAGTLTMPELVRILLNRGQVFERKFGIGRQTSAVVAGLLLDRRIRAEKSEAREVFTHLRDHRDQLPPEFVAMLSEAGRAVLREEPRAPAAPAQAAPAQAAHPAPPATDEESKVFFVGGGARTGTTLMQILLSQAETTNDMAPEAHYLRCLIASYRLAKNSLTHQIPQFFDDADDFRTFNAGIIERFVTRTRRRFSDARHLVLKDPEMTKSFPDLFELMPAARFICMVRDPRDVVASLLRVGEKMLAKGRNDFVAAATRARDVGRLCRYFTGFYAPLWPERDERFWERTLFVRYEDLVTNPEGVLEDVQAFTGLDLAHVTQSDDFDTGTVDYSARTDSPWFSKLYGKGISGARIGVYDGALSSEEIALVEHLCADFFKLFSYAAGAKSAVG
ncbi:sulfotransferase [Rhodocaloribacter sp.]